MWLFLIGCLVGAASGILVVGLPGIIRESRRSNGTKWDGGTFSKKKETSGQFAI